ncbi:MAG: hypothetical protein IPP74_13390 [Alphaproteobacteria bacterium]|nr:hypothetical protein [Alphaproteobacteria bacterium]
MTTGNFSGQSAQSLKEYNDAQQRIADQKKKDAVEEAKLMASINLENEKLRIQLKDISDYEKQKLITIAEYNSQISLAEKEYQKKGLREQLALQLRKLALEQERQITEELQKQAKAADDAFANATGISYAAYSVANPGGVDKDLPGYRPSLTKSMVENDNKTIEDQAKAWEEWNKQIKEQADAWQKSVDAGKDLSMKYAPEFDKLQMEYENEQQLIVDATFRTGEERNRVMKALNDQYLRDQAGNACQVCNGCYFCRTILI